MPALGALLLGVVIAVPAIIPLPTCAQSQSGQSQSAPQTAPEPTEGALVPDVLATLERMGKTLSANQFSFRARTIRAYTGPNGELLHIEHTINTTVRRPDRLSVDASGDDGIMKIFYDSKTIALLGRENRYALLPASGTISNAISVLIDQLGMDFPLADLISDSPSGSLLADIISGGQVGIATIDGVQCRHFFFSQLPDLDLELWLEDNDKALPRRIYVTYRTLPGRPSFIADLSEWNFSVQPADGEFVFKPATGMTQVELKPRSGTMQPSAR
jgi:hypothetical protein